LSGARRLLVARERELPSDDDLEAPRWPAALSSLWGVRFEQARAIEASRRPSSNAFALHGGALDRGVAEFQQMSAIETLAWVPITFRQL